MSKTHGTKTLETPYADLGSEFVNAFSRYYKDRFSSADRPVVRTLRFDRGSFGNSDHFREGEILHLKDGAFFRIVLIEESWDEPCHEHFELERRLVHVVPVIPEERLERRGRACRLAPSYDHAVSEPPRLPWRTADGSRLAAEASPVLTGAEYDRQTVRAIGSAAATYAAVSASSVFSYAAAALLTRRGC